MPGKAAGGGGGVARWADAPIVGRDELLDELITVTDAAAAGAGAIVVLSGEAGIGKTTVARAVARHAGSDMSVSWGACRADLSAPPFWPWRELLEPETEVVAVGSDDAPGGPRLERLLALRDQLRGRALERPRVHVIEDLQWADVASVLLLAHVGTTVAEVPLLIVATLRDGEPRSPQLDDAVEEVRRVARVRHLAGLDSAAVADLIRISGHPADDELVALVQERTGGNPLFVSELLRAAPLTDSIERRLQLVTATVPERVSDLVLNRLRRLPQPVVDALITASVLGADGEVATLSAAHGCTPEDLLDLLDQGRAAHVLDAAPPGDWRFRHGLIRDAVYESTTESDRARRHARVLDALASSADPPPALVAQHALAAQPLVDTERAVALAARAGEAAFVTHAYEEAVEWFARALSAAKRDASRRWRAELLLLSGEAHRHLGNIETARRSFVEAAALTDDPAFLARAALGYADPGADLGIAYRTDDAVTTALLERALAAQPASASVVNVQLEARLAAVLYFSDEPGRGRDLARVAVERARALGDPRALAIATSLFHDALVVGQAPLDEQLEESSRLLEWARQSGAVSAQLTARRARAFDLLAAGDLAGMDEQIVAFTRIAGPLRTTGYLWWPALWSAMRALLEGRHAVAEERALEAYALGASTFPRLSLMNLSFLLFFLRREQGRLAEMEQATRDYAASQADIPALQVALVLLLAEIGRHDEARPMLAGFDEPALAHLRDRNWPASWFQLARAAYLLGDRSAAATLLDPAHVPTERCVQVSLATVCLGATDLARAWLLHTAGDLDAADERYRAAEALHARLGARSWLAQGRADHARLLLERNTPGDAEEAERLAGSAQASAAEIGLATIARPAAARRHARFCRTGSVWDITFGDRDVQITDGRGMRDVAYLLSRPHEAVSVLELAGEGVPDPHATRGPAALDDRARREIRARLHELDAEEADAEASGDGERAALVRERRQQLAEAVARDFGLGGRSRLVGDPVERARKTVSTRIRRTIAAVARAHPELGRHLDRSIDTGAWCAYRPAEPVDWRT